MVDLTVGYLLTQPWIFWDDLRHFRLKEKESILPNTGWVALAHEFNVEVVIKYLM